jgi:hypothetical protein
MGNKNKGKREEKKKPKPKPKVEPGRRRDDPTNVTSHIVRDAT